MRLGLFALCLLGCGDPCGSCSDASTDVRDDVGLDGPLDASFDVGGDAPGPRRVLLFTRTEGFRHGSIEPGATAIAAALELDGFEVARTEETAVFADAELSRHAAVVFLSTTGDVLDAPEEAALQRYVEGGGGWVGIHAAADCEYDWAWYGTLVGAWFARHPAIQTASLSLEATSHPAVAHFPGRFERTDEWYDFRMNPRAVVEVLLTIDESTYTGGGMGADHPMAWAHELGAGRALYTALGHTDESYAEPAFVEHLRRAIRWAARLD